MQTPDEIEAQNESETLTRPSRRGFDPRKLAYDTVCVG